MSVPDITDITGTNGSLDAAYSIHPRDFGAANDFVVYIDTAHYHGNVQKRHENVVDLKRADSWRHGCTCGQNGFASGV